MRISVYQPGESVVHRLPAKYKLLIVLCFGLLVVIFRSPLFSIGALTMALLISVVAGISFSKLFKSFRPLVVVVLILALFQWWINGWPWAIEVTATLLSLAVMASNYSATTSVDETLDVIVAGLRPFERLGVNSEKVALASSLMIGSLWAIGQIAKDTNEAVTARGLARTPRVYLAPMAIRTVAHGQEKGEALVGRGISS